MSAKVRLVAILTLVVVIAVGFSACAPMPPAPGVSTEPEDGGKGGTIIAASFADAEILNPILSTDTASNEVNSMLYNALVQLDVDDVSVVPDLAERWEVSEDELTFTYYLREGVTWHDGEPFTAEDVRFTYETILNEDVNSPRRSDFVDILAADNITVIDDTTISFKLNTIDPTWMCCKDIYGIIPKHILGDMSAEDFNTADFNTKAPIGTGPFKFVEWVKDGHVELVRNPDYFGGTVEADSWFYKVVENQTVEFAQLQTEEVHYAGITAALWEEAQSIDILECKAYPRFAFTFYVYNLDPEKSPLFLDVRTRQALLLALDREAMVDSIAFGLADVANSVVPPISWAHNPDNAPTYGYDVEQAQSLLEAAGWKDEDGDGVREAHGVEGVEDGTKFSFEVHTNAGNQEREQVIVAMQQYWAEVGVDCVPTPIEWNALLAELTETYAFEMIVVGFSWDVDPDQKTMWHTDSYGAGFNMNKYSNSEMDTVLEAGLATTDVDARKVQYYRMQEILAEEVPAPILYFRRGTGCWNKRLHEFEFNAIDNYYHPAEWWLE